MINDETFITVNKYQVFIVSLIFWFAGVVMFSWILCLFKLWLWVFAP